MCSVRALTKAKSPIGTTGFVAMGFNPWNRKQARGHAPLSRFPPKLKLYNHQNLIFKWILTNYQQIEKKSY